MDLARLRLAPEQLRRICERDRFDFRTTSELPLNRSIIGQERGVAAIEFGISITAPNFNLFVLGPTGSGRLTAVKHFINMQAINQPAPDDICYVHNFAEPHRPRAIRLSAGRALQFRADMEHFIQKLRAELAALFSGEPFQQAERMIVASLMTERDNLIRPVQQMATAKGFVLQQTPQGALMIIPVHEGQPVTPDILESLSAEQQDEILTNRRELEVMLEDTFQQSRSLQERAQKALSDLQKDFAAQVIDSHMAEIMSHYDLYGAIINYLKAVRDDVLNSLDEFQNQDDETLFGEHGQRPSTPPVLSPTHDSTKRYTVNVLTANDPDAGAPVVLLDLPTYQNLVGHIEHVVRYGMMTTDFSLIRPGALHQANGGFLIVRASDILQHPFAWELLKPDVT
ncbi:MAG: AAA family ATPase [Chloroflexi bacterium]|nr:AAA family ATPase [Chloroflexota bacterium]